MKILYMTSGDMWKLTGNSIQVIDELKNLCKMGHSVNLLIFPHRSLIPHIREDLDRLRNSLGEVGAELHIVPLLMDSISRFLNWQLLYYSSRIRRLLKRGDYDLVSAHDIRTSAFAACVKRSMGKRIHMVYDMHGAGIAEALFNKSFSEGSVEHRVRKQLEADAVFTADLIFVVSSPFKRWVCDQYGADEGKIWITPSSCDIGKLPSREWRHLQRVNLGIGDRPVLLYSGSILSWQRAEDLFRLFLRLKDRISGLFLLVMTPHEESAVALLYDCGVAAEDCRVLKVPSSEVQTMMSIADIGSLLRNSHLLNEVASPVKFADYLGAGVPVLLSPRIGDCDEIAAASGLCVVWDEERDSVEELAERLAALLEARSDEQRETCRRLAKDRFSWDNTMQVFRQALESLRTG